MKEFVEKLIEKIKVTSLEIIVTGTKDKPYFEIKYKEVGKEDYNIGYSSYDLNNVLNWKEECFEIVNQLAEEYGKDTNVTTNNGWIPCEKELPSKSGKYIVTQERYSIDDIFHTGRKRTEVDYVEFNANDNMWSRANFFNVIAWLPLPEPYQKGE